MQKCVLNVVGLKITTVHVKPIDKMQTSEIIFNEITKIYSMTVSTTEKTSLTILKKMLDA